MANTPLDKRRFTEEEVGAILEKAVEHAPARELVKSEGVSLAELKTIGEEVGIDPARLEDAARAVALESRQRPNKLIGVPTVLTTEKRVTGEFASEDTAEILSIIRRDIGHRGEIHDVQGRLEWGATSDLAERYVTVSSRDGKTTISASSNLNSAALVTFLPVSVLGVLISLLGLLRFAKSGSEMALIVCLGSLAATVMMYPVLRGVWGKISGAESAKLEMVVDELAQLVEGATH